MLGIPKMKTQLSKCSLLYLLTILLSLEQELWLLGTTPTWGNWHFQQTKPVSHHRLKYSKIRSWDQPTNQAKQEFTLHYDQSKLIESDTLKDLFCSVHVWLFCLYFIKHTSKKFRTLIPTSALGWAVGQNLTFSTLLLSPDIPVLFKPPEITYWLLTMHRNSKPLFFHGFLASFPKPYSSQRSTFLWLWLFLSRGDPGQDRY